jgi:hypothetical protein
MAFEFACVVADRGPGRLRDDASDFICVSRDQANLSLETNSVATENRQILSWFGHSSFVIDSSFEFRHSNLALIRRMAFEVACVVADCGPGMLRDDASDFICVSRDQANVSSA